MRFVTQLSEKAQFQPLERGLCLPTARPGGQPNLGTSVAILQAVKTTYHRES